MPVFKCKMCGGQLEITAGMTVCECEYCGTTQTLPKTDNEQLLNMLNRANHFRQQCEFDKAAEVYEKLIVQNDQDAELYWSLVLCRYGIEYVDDPLTKKKIATCHRTQFKSILEDADYLSALSHADLMQKPVFEAEAKYIDTVQKGILEISNKEEPFDVFICYKESDANGRRTPDSVLAQELYYQLEREGFKVFFSRITLEKKLGTQYEPYIFAALNSAKVMVVVGTKPEHFNAVWVKNEWSRYLMLMQEDRTRTLIPAYKDMDPYDLPDALSMFQAQDMSKLGFMQDLIRGIQKITKQDEPKPQVVQQTVVQNVGNTNTAPLLKRIKLFLEDGDWNSANEYCNRVLDLDPECAQAYFYLMMAKMNVRTEQELERVQSEDGIANDEYYKKAFRFADDALKARLDTLHQQTIYNYAEMLFSRAALASDYMNAQKIYSKISNFRDTTEKMNICKQNALQCRYNSVHTEMQAARTEREYQMAAEAFRALGDFKDAAQKAQECLESAENARKEKLYTTAKEYANADTVSYLERAIEIYTDIADFRDSAAQIEKCKERIEEIKAKQQEKERQLKQRTKRNRKIAIVCAVVVIVGIAGTVTGINVHKANLYKAGISALEAGDFEEAYKKFNENALSGYKDTETQLKEVAYREAIAAMEAGDYNKAYECFETIKDYKDVQTQMKETIYREAFNAMESSDYITAYEQFSTLGEYKDAAEQLKEVIYREGLIAFETGDYDKAREKYGIVKEYKDSIAYLKKINASDPNRLKIKTNSLDCTTAHSIGLKTDGSVVAVGNNEDGQCSVSAWNDIISISGGNTFTVGLKPDGTVVTVGSNDEGQCNVSDWTDIIAISACACSTIGLKSDGTVVATGSNEFHQCDVSSWRDITAISAGYGHNVGLKKDGTVVASGDNSSGQCNVSSWKNIITVSACCGHTLGIKEDGTVVAVGDNQYGQCNVSGWNNIVAVAGGADYSIGLQKDGTLLIVGELGFNSIAASDIAKWKDIVAVSGDLWSILALKADGTVVSSGDNYAGQCNVSEWQDIMIPKK